MNIFSQIIYIIYDIHIYTWYICLWTKTIPSREINISPYQGIFEDDFPIPQVGYVDFLEGIYIYQYISASLFVSTWHSVRDRPTDPSMFRAAQVMELVEAKLRVMGAWVPQLAVSPGVLEPAIQKWRKTFFQLSFLRGYEIYSIYRYRYVSFFGWYYGYYMDISLLFFWVEVGSRSFLVKDSS